MTPLIMIPALNTSSRMTPTVLMRMMIRFMNNNSGDHGTHCIVEVALKSAAILAMLSLSILSCCLFDNKTCFNFSVKERSTSGLTFISTVSVFFLPLRCPLLRHKGRAKSFPY